MAQPYLFQVSMPVHDVMPRNRFINAVHLEHVAGSVLDTDLEAVAGDIVAMYQTRYGNSTREVQCKAYDVGPKPNNPRANVIVNAGVPWPCSAPMEIALVLSYAGDNRGDKRRRGRMYLAPQLAAGVVPTVPLRPNQAMMDWALAFYTTSNASWPDIGGVDWKFGVWSRVGQHFTQTTQAWVNDEWDIQRHRGLRESTRVTANREG